MSLSVTSELVSRVRTCRSGSHLDFVPYLVVELAVGLVVGLAVGLVVGLAVVLASQTT